ncbi:MAG: RIP metalloprotease RseP [Verrucomicrobiota bacterium]|nr:RIP metalloprotease RseP [Verrucomicrobiota bacterium]
MSLDTFLGFLKTPWGMFLAVLFFGASIFVHELGHFLAAKWRGLKIECFSIGFGPAIWRHKDRNGIEWKVCWLPLGGYVRLPQLGDMQGMEGETETPEEMLPPISYADKMYVSVMGAVFNIIFAFILAFILWPSTDKIQVRDTATVIGYVEPTLKDAVTDTMVPSAATKAGLKPGDKILSVDGKKVEDFQDIMLGVIFGAGRSADGAPETVMEIERDDKASTVILHPVLTSMDKVRTLGIEPYDRLVVGVLVKDNPAVLAGLLPDDEILKADGIAYYSRTAFSTHVEKSAGKPIVLTVKRGTETMETTIAPKLIKPEGESKPRYILGIVWKPVFAEIHIAPWTRIWNNAQTMYRTVTALITRHTNVGLNTLNGPLVIGDVLYTAAKLDFRTLINIVILINVNLAILNLMPIPVLDGGHMLIATINRFSRRSISKTFIRKVQEGFALLLIGLMLYVSGRDVMRLFIKYNPPETEERSVSEPAK